jgi:hypothetical protein
VSALAKIILSFVLISLSCVLTFALAMFMRNTRRDREEKDRKERTRRMSLRDWRAHNRLRSIEGRKPRTPRPVNTEREHKRTIDRRNIP